MEGVAVSKFQVGDRVRCVKTSSGTDAGAECVVSVVDKDETIKVEGNHMWHMDYNFELIPQPVESPDDWVTQDVVRARPEIDQRAYLYDRDPGADLLWDDAGEMKWEVMPMHGHRLSDCTVHLRCRRRDYPQQPVEVYSGGPCVARSEYERVCLELRRISADRIDHIADAANATKQRDDALAHAVRIRDESVKAIDALLRELANEKASSGQVIMELRTNIDSLNDLLKTREKAAEVTQAETIRYAEKCEKLEDGQKNLLADLKDIEQTVTHLNKRVFVDNPNGWPLVPVDPACIPDGHRAVEVTDQVNGKTTVIDFGRVHTWDTSSQYVQLVVEPIPTPAPDALPRPEFPAWIRAGWWVAMDAGGFWYMSKDEPIATEPVLGSTADRGTWNPPGMDDIQITQRATASMQSIPANRWREAKWQVV